MYKPTSNDSLFRKFCRKITEICEHWFVKTLLKPVFFILPPSLVTWAATKSNIKQDLDTILSSGVSQFLTQSSLVVLVGAYIYMLFYSKVFIPGLNITQNLKGN